MTKKFCLILLRDIMKGRNSIVKRAFSEYLSSDVESQIKAKFSTDNIKPDDDINTSVDQTKSLSANIAWGLEYPVIDGDGRTEQGEPQAFLEKLFVFLFGANAKVQKQSATKIACVCMLLFYDSGLAVTGLG